MSSFLEHLFFILSFYTLTTHKANIKDISELNVSSPIASETQKSSKKEAELTEHL